MIEINEIFLKHNIKKSDLSKILNVSPQYITKVFNGSKNISPFHIETLQKKGVINEQDAELLLIKYFLEKSPQWFLKKILTMIK